MCESKKEVLDNIFESRETNLYALTEEDKKRIENLTKNNDSYEKFYKIGFSDAINLILECVRINKI